MSARLARLRAVLFGDDVELILHRLQLLAAARWRSLLHGCALVMITTIISMPKLTPLLLAAGLAAGATICVMRYLLSARLGRQVARHDLPAARRSEYGIALTSLLLAIYAGLLIGMPPTLTPQRQAVLLLIAVTVPLVANRSLAASPLNFIALCLPLFLSAVVVLFNDPALNHPSILVSFAIAQVIAIEVVIAYVRAHRRSLGASLRERRLIAQQWALFETSQLGIALTDRGELTRVNARLQSWFAPDGDTDKLIGEIAARTGRTPERIRALIRRAEARVHGHTARSCEFPLITGTPGCIEVQVRRFDPLHPGAGLLWTVSDRSADYQHRQALERDAQRDALTGVLNRRGLMARLSQLLGRDLHTRPLALLCLDLNGFKPLNDKHGHAFGDRVLCTVAQRLQNALRSTDVVARTGGDEFVVVLDPLDDGITAAMVAERLGELIAVPMLLEGVGCQVQAAIGLAVAPADGADAEPLLRRADRAMYEVKRAVSPGRPRSAPQNSPDPRSPR